jgi:ribonuclease HII|uniref:Ribonuclease HII n=1 Tax=viral metagenome TaxID=1070528 RepID=A0A6C0CVK6_9ZZZZ
MIDDINTQKQDGQDCAKEPKKRIREKQLPLSKCFTNDNNIIEIGVDEVGRGPLFGRVYVAAVILPKDDSFDHSKMKDSKKFHSKKKIEEVSEYIKKSALAWAVCYEDEKVIDEINILQATQRAMHKCIAEILKKEPLIFETDSTKDKTDKKIQLIIDGNYFNPFMHYNQKRKILEQIPHVCIEGGDNKYSSIAAASILAKVTRDTYIDELCQQNPELIERYSIDSNKGYGAKKHLDGIKEHGITIWHRRSFGICKEYV